MVVSCIEGEVNSSAKPGANVDLAGHGGGDQGGAAWVEGQ